MQFKQMSLLFQFLTINFVLVLSFVPNSNLAIGKDSVTQDLPSIAVESNTKRVSPAILADNINYEEKLMLEIWHDGSVKSLYKLEDAGNGILGFPVPLPIPLNASYPRVRDMRIDFLINEVPQLSSEWGFMADYDQFGDYDRDYASFSSNEILMRFQVWNETNSLNETQLIVEEIVDDLSAELETDFHLMTNRTGTFDGDYGLEISWRAFLFDLNSTWYNLFSLLPLTEGLGTTSASRLMQADARSLHVVADWDELHNRSNPATLYDLDERWEFETTFGILERQKLNLSSSSNQIYLNDLIDFSQILNSHSKANDSEISIRLPYGTRIDAVVPTTASDVNDVCYFELDLIDNHDSRVTDHDYVNVTMNALPMPSLIVHAAANTTVAAPGDIVEITYTIANLGNFPAYNVRLWGFDNTTGSSYDEWNFINVTQRNYNYTLLVGGRAYFDIAQISAGENVSRTVVLNATTPTNQWNGTFISESYVNYDAVINPASSIGWIEENIEQMGNDLDFWYNHSNPGPAFDLDVWPSKSIVSVGETVIVHANVTNTGSMTAWDIAWEAPRFGFNTTNMNGLITSLNPGESAVINTTYIADAATEYLIDSIGGTNSLDSAPTRQLGGACDLNQFTQWWYPDSDNGRDYSGWYITEWYANTSYYTYQNPDRHDDYGDRGDVYGSEIRLHILPETNQTFGPFLTTKVDYSSINVTSGERLTISVTVKNIGTMAAENVEVTSEFSDLEFDFYAGAGTDIPQSATQGRRFVYQWGTLASGDSFSFSFQLEAQEDAISYTYTYAMADWGDFPGLDRMFFPRTYDWEAPTITGPADLEIIKKETDTITASLSWLISDEHSGTYQLLRGILSNFLGEDIAYVEVASGNWNIPRFQIAFSLATLEDGEYEFILEATDCCGNSAIDRVNVTIETLEEESEEDGLLEETEDFFLENAPFLLIIGALAAIVIIEGAIIYFMRK
ncbi:MAG: hypothetical protein ACFFB3_15495 [Candidatus Hodarchaeota archaeon]